MSEHLVTDVAQFVRESVEVYNDMHPQLPDWRTEGVQTYTPPASGPPVATLKVETADGREFTILVLETTR